MRAMIVAIFLLVAYAFAATDAHAATFRTLPPMLVLSHEESQELFRKEYIARALEAGEITQAEAQNMQDAEMSTLVLEDGYWGIMIVPRQAGQPSQ